MVGVIALEENWLLKYQMFELCSTNTYDGRCFQCPTRVVYVSNSKFTLSNWKSLTHQITKIPQASNSSNGWESLRSSKQEISYVITDSCTNLHAITNSQKRRVNVTFQSNWEEAWSIDLASHLLESKKVVVEWPEHYTNLATSVCFA